MLFEEAFYSQLAENSAVAAIVGDRVFPVEIPQFEAGRQTYPCVVYQLAARLRLESHDGPSGTVESTVGVSCLSQDYFEVKKLAQAVRKANATVDATDPLAQVCLLTTTLQDETDLYEYDELESLSLYHVRQTYLMRHTED